MFEEAPSFTEFLGVVRLAPAPSSKQLAEHSRRPFVHLVDFAVALSQAPSARQESFLAFFMKVVEVLLQSSVTAWLITVSAILLFIRSSPASFHSPQPFSAHYSLTLLISIRSFDLWGLIGVFMGVLGPDVLAFDREAYLH